MCQLLPCWCVYSILIPMSFICTFYEIIYLELGYNAWREKNKTIKDTAVKPAISK